MDVSHEHIYKNRWLLNRLGTGKSTNFRARCHMHTSGVWGSLTTSVPLPDRVKNEDCHEGQEMQALPQKVMLTLDNLMVEPHIRRTSSSEHNAAISKVIMLGKEWEPSPYKAALWSCVDFLIHRLLHS